MRCNSWMGHQSHENLKLWFLRILFLLCRADSCRVMKWNTGVMISSYLVMGYHLLPAEQLGKSEAGRWGKLATPSVSHLVSHKTCRMLSVKHNMSCLACPPRLTVLLLDLIIWYHVAGWDSGYTSSWTLRPRGSFWRAHFLPRYPAS